MSGAVRVLVISNPRATATTARERDVLAHALGSDGRAWRSPRPPTAATPQPSPAARCATAPTSSWPWAVTARSTRSSTACSPTACTTGVPALGRRAGRIDERLRARARPAQRPDRGHRRAARGAAQRVPTRRSASARSTTGGSSSPPAWASTPRSSTAWSGTGGAASGRRTRCTRGSGVREFFRPTAATRSCTSSCRTARPSTTSTSSIVANADPWTFVGNRPLHPTPDVDFDTGLGALRPAADGHVRHAVEHGPDVRRTPRVGARGAHLRHDLIGLTDLGATSRCRSRSTATSSGMPDEARVRARSGRSCDVS